MTIRDLLAQLPETDREIQAKEPPPQTPEEQKRRRRDQYPDNWGSASKFTGPDPALARKLSDQVFAGGRKSISELICLLDSAPDYKPEYLLHCLAVFANGRQRTLLTRTIADELGTSKSQPILIRELQYIGSDDTAKSLGRYLTDDNLCGQVATALTAIGGNAAAAEYRKALPKATGKCRLTIAQNLGVLRDPKSADALRKSLLDSDPDLRQTAAWSLARMGDTQSVEPLIKLADTAQGHARTKATSTLLLLAENLAMQGKKSDATRIYTHIQNTRTKPEEKYLRDTAARHLTIFML